jgi:hypothetical protein
MSRRIGGHGEMAIGFSNRFDFRPIIGWELHQITIDKYHVMFWFENGHALLNVADRFSLKSFDEAVSFTYEIYGDNKFMNLDRVLRVRIGDVHIVTKDQLDLVFENKDVLTVYDNPELRSWWFFGGQQLDPPIQRTRCSFQISDWEPEDLTEAELQERRR